MSTPIRFGLIGTGRIGQIHAANIAASPEAKLSWVADPIAQSARNVADTFGAHYTDTPAELFDASRVDALLIAAPTPTHLELIAAAVDAEIPALCEKPADLSIERVDRVRAKVSSSAVPIGLGFNRRFDPSVAEIHSRFMNGEIGNLEQLTIVSRDPTPPPLEYLATSGGIFRDMTIHDFDMARFFVKDIVSVFATGGALFDSGAAASGDLDTAVSVLRGADGETISITNSRHAAYGYDQRIEVFGDRGQLTLHNQGSSLVSSSNATAVESRAPYQRFFLERYVDAYRLELDEFIKLARGLPSTTPTFEDGRAALVLADAAQRSADSGTVVLVESTSST